MSFNDRWRKKQTQGKNAAAETPKAPKAAPVPPETITMPPLAEGKTESGDRMMELETGEITTVFARHVRDIKTALSNTVEGYTLSDETRERLDAFDGTRLSMDKEMLELRWRQFHGAMVHESMIELGHRNAQLTAESGYVDLVRSNVGKLVGADGRELELRNRELMLSNVRSHPIVAEMMAAARDAQLMFKAAIGNALFSADDIGMLAISNPDADVRLAAAKAKETARGSLGPLKESLATALAYASIELEGRESYGHLLLEIQDSDVDEFSRFIMSLKERTEGAMAALNEAVCKTFKLKSVPHRDRMFFYNSYFSLAFPDVIPKDPVFAMAKLKETLRAMGFGKVHGTPFLDIDGLERAPFTFDILGGPMHAPEECAMRSGPGGNDYRVFINPELSPSGVEYMRTLLLESARAVHFYALDRLDSRSAFKWEADCMRSAVAMLISSAVSEEKWLRDIAGIGPGDAKLLAATLSYQEVRMAREQAVEALFEMKLQFRQEAEKAYREAHEMFWGSKIEYPVENEWAWHPYLAFNPGGQLSYALAYSIYEMMREDIDNKFGTLLDPGVAEYLVDNHMAGHEKPWKERLKRILKGG